MRKGDHVYEPMIDGPPPLIKIKSSQLRLLVTLIAHQYFHSLCQSVRYFE